MNGKNWFRSPRGKACGGRRERSSRLALLHALKDAKWVVRPDLFVSLDETRWGPAGQATALQITELQWEFFYTCWRYNLDFYRGHDPAILRRFNLGVPLYYYLMGRRMFGSAMKYPALRLAHFSEKFLSRKLYLDLRKAPKYNVPEQVDIPTERMRPAIPVLAD